MDHPLWPSYYLEKSLDGTATYLSLKSDKRRLTANAVVAIKQLS